MVCVFKNMDIKSFLISVLICMFTGNIPVQGDIPSGLPVRSLEELASRIQSEKVLLHQFLKEISIFRNQFEQLLSEYEKNYNDYARNSELWKKDLEIFQYTLSKIEEALEELENFMQSSIPLFHSLHTLGNSLFLQLYRPEDILYRQQPEKELYALFYYQKLEQMTEELYALVKTHVANSAELLQQKENILSWISVLEITGQIGENKKDSFTPELQSLEELRAEIQQKLDERRPYTEQLEKLITDLSSLHRDAFTPAEAEFDEGNIQKGGLPWPTEGDLIESFTYNWQNPHDPQNNPGIAIASLYKQEVISVANGEVVFTDWFDGYGNLILVDHGKGILTSYAHLKESRTINGTTVKQGDVIGTVGNSSSIKGPTLHFSVRVHSIPQDPQEWLSPTK